MRSRRKIRITKKMIYDNGKKLIVPLLIVISLSAAILGIRFLWLRYKNSKELLELAMIRDAIIEEQNRRPEENLVVVEEIVDPSIRIEEIIEEYELEYKTLYETDDTLPKGMIQVKQEGRTGKVEVIIQKKYKDEELIEEKQVSNKMLKVPIDKLVVTGTSKYKSDYKIKVGDKLYVSSYNLSIRQDKDPNAQKIITIEQDSEVKLLEIDGSWYKVQYQSYIGYARSRSINIHSATSKL